MFADGIIFRWGKPLIKLTKIMQSGTSHLVVVTFADISQKSYSVAVMFQQKSFLVTPAVTLQDNDPKSLANLLLVRQISLETVFFGLISPKVQVWNPNSFGLWFLTAYKGPLLFISVQEYEWINKHFFGSDEMLSHPLPPPSLPPLKFELENRKLSVRKVSYTFTFNTYKSNYLI